MKDNKPQVVSNKTIAPFILVASLFALWGFANAVTDPMVQAFKNNPYTHSLHTAV